MLVAVIQLLPDGMTVRMRNASTDAKKWRSGSIGIDFRYDGRPRWKLRKNNPDPNLDLVLGQYQVGFA